MGGGDEIPSPEIPLVFIRDKQRGFWGSYHVKKEFIKGGIMLRVCHHVKEEFIIGGGGKRDTLPRNPPCLYEINRGHRIATHYQWNILSNVCIFAVYFQRICRTSTELIKFV